MTVIGAGGSITNTLTVGFVESGARNWFNAQSIDGTYNSSLSADAAVTTWTNLGSLTETMTQTTAANQPIYKMNCVNGQACLRFDGTDFLKGVNASDYTFMHNGSDYTIFFLYKTTLSNPNSVYVAVSTANTAGASGSRGASFFLDDRVSQTREDKQMYWISTGAGFNLNAQPVDDSAPAGEWNIVSGLVDDDGSTGMDVTQWINSRRITTNNIVTAYSATDPSSALSIGAQGNGGNALVGDMVQVIIYPTALTTAERASVEDALSWAYELIPHGKPSVWLSAQNIDGSSNSTLTDTNPVSAWTNLGLIAESPLQGTGANQPTYVQSCFTNGKSCLSFDGGDSLIASTASHYAFMNSGVGAMIYIVWAEDVATNGFYSPLSTMNLAANSRGVGMSLNDNTANETLRIYQGSGAGITFATSAASSFPRQQWHLVSYYILNDGTGAADIFAYLNKSLITSAPSTGFNVGDPACPLTIGSACGLTYPLQGKIAEIMIYNWAMDTTQRTRAEEYIEGKYGITFPIAD